MSLTASQLVALATQAAGVTGWTSQAGQLLNMVLSDLAETYDFDVARGAVTLNLTAQSGFGPYQLPTDYLRADPGEVFYTLNQVPYELVSIDLAEFDELPQQPGNTAFPTFYATDMSTSPPSLYLWPQPQQVLALTMRYRRQMPDIAAPASSTTIPWFPNQTYLLTRLTGELFKLSDDERCSQFLHQAEAELDRYLKLKDDKSARAQTVKLDRRRFTPNFNRLPGTKVVGPL